MEANLLAPDVPIRFAKIRLCMARTMAQRNKHLLPSQPRLREILAHDRVAAGKALLIPQPLENPPRRVPLLLMNLAVFFENGIDPRHIWPQRLRYRPFTPPVAGWNGKTQHLRDRVAVDAKPLCRFPSAQPINHHRASDLGIQFHCEHPSSPSMPSSGTKMAYKGLVHFCPAFTAQRTAGSVVHFASAIYKSIAFLEKWLIAEALKKNIELL